DYRAGSGDTSSRPSRRTAPDSIGTDTGSLVRATLTVKDACQDLMIFWLGHGRTAHSESDGRPDVLQLSVARRYARFVRGLTLGEALDASGRAILEAMIAGVEVMCRVGLAVPGKFHARHYHPTSLTGGFAAAAVAGKLYGLEEDQLVHAFGICGSQAGGIIE